jgi:hypothetical protein
VCALDLERAHRAAPGNVALAARREREPRVDAGLRLALDL